MSASSKKKLRNAQNAEKLTEKQLAEQKEAKKLKTYTTAFVAVMALVICLAVFFAVSNTITSSGVREKNTIALTVGDHEISNAQFNYYYMDAINEFMNNYGSYAYIFGLDTTVALDKQVTNNETGATWADDFKADAMNAIQSVYALVDAANEAGFTLSDDQIASVDNQIANAQLYANLYYGYTDLEQYLKVSYGYGATEENFREYLEMNTLAQAYSSHYAQGINIEEDAIRAEDTANPVAYNGYSYNYYYLNATKFLEGGTTAEDGTTTYSDEEKAASVAAAEAAAKALTTGIDTVEALDAAIAALPINAETTAASTASDDVSSDSIMSYFADWVLSADRKEGDITYVANTSTDAEGKETVNGYYVVLFRGVNDNNYPLANVRHILVGFEGGITDPNTGVTTYSDEQKAIAKEEAEKILADWQAGKALEETFAALANELSDDGDGTTGGLYTDVYPGQMVVNFNDWCFAEGRKAGDTGIVESEYGYHVMYYSGDSETMFRTFLIENALASAEYSEWTASLVEATAVTEKNMKYISTDLVLAN